MVFARKRFQCTFLSGIMSDAAFGAKHRRKKYSGRSIIRIVRGVGEKFVTSRVGYIERFHNGSLSQGEQTLVRYIKSSYHRGFVLSSLCCIIILRDS